MATPSLYPYLLKAQSGGGGGPSEPTIISGGGGGAMMQWEPLKREININRVSDDDEVLMYLLAYL